MTSEPKATKPARRQSGKKGILFTALFLLGLAIFLYPLISQWYYSRESERQVTQFRGDVDRMDDADVLERIDLAHAYNETLDPRRIADPFSEREQRGRAEYARMLELHEKMGYVSIPSIGQELPVYAGTSEVVLQKGVGHLEGTSLPVGGIGTHAVITAHRGLPKAKLFTDLDKLKEGDVFYYTNIQTTLAYRVDTVRVIEPTDFEPVLVVEGEDRMTLLTCTPYMINSHRLIVQGHRIDYTPPVQEYSIVTNRITENYRNWTIGLAVVATGLIIGIIRNHTRWNHLRKETRK